MQDEKQYEQLMLQYKQLRNGAEDISRMIDIEDFDSAITMIRAREELFLSCKCIRRYLELTPEQEVELNAILSEIREMELENINKLSKSMSVVQQELKRTQQTEKIQQAYDFNENQRGSIVNIKDS